MSEGVGGPGEGKNTRLKAVLLSALVCPGAGQLYKRQYFRGGALVFLSLAIIAVIFVKVSTSMMEIVVQTPPDQLVMDVLGITHKILDNDTAFFSMTGYLLLAVWVYGMLDAALTKARPKRGGVA